MLIPQSRERGPGEQLSCGQHERNRDYNFLTEETELGRWLRREWEEERKNKMLRLGAGGPGPLWKDSGYETLDVPY